MMQLVHHYGLMSVVRKTTPFTAAEDEQISAFSRSESWEHLALERVSPVPLREGSQGAVVRALALLGMAYVRESANLAASLAAGYDELAAERAELDARPAGGPGMRANMARRAGSGSRAT